MKNLVIRISMLFNVMMFWMCLGVTMISLYNRVWTWVVISSILMISYLVTLAAIGNRH